MKRTQQHRKKELTETQQLKLENKSLRAENSQLKRENRKLRKTEHFHEKIAPFEDEDQQLPLFEVEEERKHTKCPECSKGDLIIYNIVGRTWNECSMCDYRTKTIRTKLD